MTKTQAQALARSLLSHGYFAHGLQDMDVFYDPGDGRRRLRIYGQCGRIPPRPEQIRQLTAALLELDEFGETGAEVRP